MIALKPSLESKMIALKPSLESKMIALKPYFGTFLGKIVVLSTLLKRWACNGGVA